MSFNLKLFFTFVIFGVFLALFTVYSFSKITVDRKLQNELETTHELIKIKESQVSNLLNDVDDYILSISQNKIFRTFTKEGSEIEYIEELLKTVTQSSKNIAQIRYIDKSGKELINMEYIDKNKFSNNSKMEQLSIENNYIEQIASQKIGHLWHSRMGVNIQTESNSKNLIPMMVVGINTGYGVLEFKISLEEILSFLNDDYHRFLLVDNQGNILIDSKENIKWVSSKKSKPDLKDVVTTADMYFLQQHYTKTDNFISMKISAVNKDNLLLIVLYADYESMIDGEMYNIYLAIFLSTIVLAIVLAYFFSKPMVRMTNKIVKLNNHLDKKVERRTHQMHDLIKLIDKYVIRSVTDPSGVIINVSEAFCEISKYSKEELIGRQHSLVRHPDMDPAIFKNLWETIQSGNSWEGKIKNLAKDGSYYWVEANIEPNYENGKIVSYTAIRMNITDKVLLEELNESLNEKIKQEVDKNTEQLELIQKEQLKSVKLTSIGALAAGITHEINTPLTYIKGNFEMIKYDIEDLPQSEIRDRILEDTEVITDGINRIANIVDAMKEVSHVSNEAKETINLYSTIITSLVVSNNRVKQITKVKVNGKLFNIDMDKDELMFNVTVQKQRIEQVWIILITNALDELIKVDEYENRMLNIDISSNEKKIIVEVSDSAGGIDEKIIDNLFEPFVSMKVSGGIGIGLNIAKKILTENDGTIVAKNIPNGALFRIEFNIT
jgi:PAS domain S-box-containing protein